MNWQSSSFFSCGAIFIFVYIATFASQVHAQEAEPKKSVVQVAGSEIEITLPEEPMALSTSDILNWVKNCANAVATYYGRFPVPHLLLRIRAGEGTRVGHATTYPRHGGLIVITVGRQATTQALADDWVLTHEMVHLAFPSMEDDHRWIEEGLSTYVEPVARVQSGQMPVTELWSQFVRFMSRGQPQSDDQGLDRTHTWGRTYWGGAMFCLVADVRIRERTHNAKGLQDALRAILNHGGDITEDWDIQKTLEIGDAATGVTVLRNLYNEWKNKPVTVDLEQLWSKLGVKSDQDGIVFNDKAVDAAVRKGITRPAPSAKKE